MKYYAIFIHWNLYGTSASRFFSLFFFLFNFFFFVPFLLYKPMDFLLLAFISFTVNREINEEIPSSDRFTVQDIYGEHHTGTYILYTSDQKRINNKGKEAQKLNWFFIVLFSARLWIQRMQFMFLMGRLLVFFALWSVKSTNCFFFFSQNCWFHNISKRYVSFVGILGTGIHTKYPDLFKQMCNIYINNIIYENVRCLHTHSN